MLAEDVGMTDATLESRLLIRPDLVGSRYFLSAGAHALFMVMSQIIHEGSYTRTICADSVHNFSSQPGMFRDS